MSAVPLLEAIRRARDAGDVNALIDLIPYSRFLGLTADVSDGDLIVRMGFSDHLIGDAAIRALHGGTLGALLESTAIFKLLWETESADLPKTINITVEYLRSGKPLGTHARADFIRHGRRVANVRAVAWQEDASRPIAAANAHFLLQPTE
jgi:uncharacterized protein (TIGR00369 family)